MASNSADASGSPEGVTFAPSAKDTRVDALERKLRQRTCILGLLVVLLSLGVIMLLVLYLTVSGGDAISQTQTQTSSAGSEAVDSARTEDSIEDPANPGVFHALTAAEMLQVKDHLRVSINLTDPTDKSSLRDARVYTMDLELPRKSEVLRHLDHGGDQPDRFARVVVLRGDLVPPVVEERLCGPLGGTVDCTVDFTVPFAHRPIETLEYEFMGDPLLTSIQRDYGEILEDSFGVSFDTENYENSKLNWWSTIIPSGIYGEPVMKRKSWVWLRYNGYPYYGMFPLDMAFLVNVDGVDKSTFSVEKVWYAGRLFSSPEKFRAAYQRGSITKLKASFPDNVNSSFASMKPRVPETKRRTQRPPELIEPDGKRYTVQHGKIDYLDNLWTFNYRLSPISGPSIYDVRFKGERIAYEISLMDIVVQYSGFEPMTRQCIWVDSASGLGRKSKALFPGPDCPSTATVLPAVVSGPGDKEPAVYPHAMCVFEQNLGQPLRRHHSYIVEDGSFYGGMVDAALVFRSIHTVDNYDYAISFKFHQNGVLDVNVMSTGYTMSSSYSSKSEPYGRQIANNMYGPLHMHAAHFKVDVDINDGSSNRYSTMDIVEETVKVRQGKNKISQMRVKHNLKKSEQEANYNYDINKPKYNIFYNDKVRNEFGVPKAYRLLATGLASQITKAGLGNEPAFTWARHHISVTKHKDQERSSTSIYNQWSTLSPVVDFSNFYKDDESIVDEDLVAWVSLGVHHIPHTEDLPVTPTSGDGQSFYLLPNNYFQVCPSMTSSDSVYVGHVNNYHPERGMVFNVPSTGDVRDPRNFAPVQYTPKNFSAIYEKDPTSFFEHY